MKSRNKEFFGRQVKVLETKELIVSEGFATELDKFLNKLLKICRGEED